MLACHTTGVFNAAEQWRQVWNVIQSAPSNSTETLHQVFCK